MVILEDKLENIIHSYFSLGNKGFNNFLDIVKNNVLNPPEEYKFIYEENNQRKIIKIPETLKSYIDDGYPIIKNLRDFCSKYNIGYDEYNLNKTILNGNERKLFKLMCEYYISIVEGHFRDLGLHPEGGVSLGLLREVSYERGDEYSEAFRCWEKYYKPSERKQFEYKLAEKNINNVPDIISEMITKIFEKIGAFKIKTDKDLYFVISKNLNDFFLCSWERGWTSCLNPESTSTLWSALPSVISDKGRCILYITDLEEKEYQGIHSYRMYKRGWGIVGTNGEEEKIYTGTFYPSKTRMDNSFYNKIGISNLLANMPLQFISKYPIELFYNEYNVFDYMYQDDTKFVHGYDGKIRLKSGERNHCIVINDDMNGIYMSDYHMSSEGHTLSNIIEEDKQLSSYPSDHFCPRCKQISSRKKKISYRINNEQILACSSCFDKDMRENKVQCSLCSQALDFRSDIHFIGDKIVCQHCNSKTIKSKRSIWDDINPYIKRKEPDDEDWVDDDEVEAEIEADNEQEQPMAIVSPDGELQVPQYFVDYIKKNIPMAEAGLKPKKVEMTIRNDVNF